VDKDMGEDKGLFFFCPVHVVSYLFFPFFSKLGQKEKSISQKGNKIPKRTKPQEK